MTTNHNGVDLIRETEREIAAGHVPPPGNGQERAVHDMVREAEREAGLSPGRFHDGPLAGGRAGDQSRSGRFLQAFNSLAPEESHDDDTDDD